MKERISNNFRSEVERIDSLNADERYRCLLGTLRSMTINSGEYKNYKKQLGSLDIKQIPSIVKTMLDKFWNDRQSQGNNARERYKDKSPLNSNLDSDIPSEDLYWLVCSSIDKDDFSFVMNEYVSGLFDEYVVPINLGKQRKEDEIERYNENVGQYVPDAGVLKDLRVEQEQYINRINEVNNKKQIALEEIEKWSRS